MAAHRYSVTTWKKRVLQAASMRAGACTDAEGLVGIDMHAQDGTTFAHGNLDVETAERLWRQLGEAIVEARH